MNKRLVIIFGISILLAGGLVYLWQTTKRIDSSVIFLEEAGGALFAKLQNLRPLPGNTGKGNICESILDLETARMLELSVDGGTTWQVVPSDKEICANPQVFASGTRSRAVILRLVREDGHTELWYVWENGAQMIAQGNPAMILDTAPPANLPTAPRNEQNRSTELLMGLIGVLLCALIVVTVVYQSRHARTLEELLRLEEQRYFLDQKRLRKDAAALGLQVPPFEWLALRIHDAFSYRPVLLEDTMVVMCAVQLLSMLSDTGDHFMISTYPPKQLRQRLEKHLGDRKRSKLFRVTRTWQIRMDLRKAKVVRLSLGTAGEFFDIEAHQVAEVLSAVEMEKLPEQAGDGTPVSSGFWSQPPALYFYWRQA